MFLVFNVKTFIHTIELVLLVPWGQSSSSVGLLHIWQWYKSMMGDQTMPSLVRNQIIHSPEKGLYLSARFEDTQLMIPLIGVATWVAYLDTIVYYVLWGQSLSVYDLTICIATYIHSVKSWWLWSYCLSKLHGSAMYWSTTMLYIPRAWKCPPRED